MLCERAPLPRFRRLEPDKCQRRADCEDNGLASVRPEPRIPKRGGGQRPRGVRGPDEREEDQ
jgi:hypothetical protein